MGRKKSCGSCCGAVLEGKYSGGTTGRAPCVEWGQWVGAGRCIGGAFTEQGDIP